jgi:thymidylate kinase
MGDAPARPGSLIAVDGTRGEDVAAAAADIAAGLEKRGIRVGMSRWDASGIFGDLLQAAPADRRISPRAIAIAYAADIYFRLRWEIRPLLEEGAVVIAAPYLDTAIGIGQAFGVPEEWLKEILRFADVADASMRARERKRDRGWGRKPERGYGEFCAALFLDAAKLRKGRRIRIDAADWLAARRSLTVPPLTKKRLSGIAAKASEAPRSSSPTGAAGSSAARSGTGRR